MTTDEHAAVTKYIEEQHAAALVAWEQPWMTTPRASKLLTEVTAFDKSGMPKEDLEMVHYQR